MDFKQGGKGVAVGKVAEKDNTFEVSEEWDVRVYGQLLKDYIQSLVGAIYPVGSIYLSVKPTNPSTYFGGTWVTWGSGRVTSPIPRRISCAFGCVTLKEFIFFAMSENR